MYEKIDDPGVSQKKIKEIEFRYSNNFLLNSGIIALDHYLEKFKEKTDISYEFKLSEKALLVRSDELSRLLEEVYYFMGKEIYDTSGESANKKADKFYFKKNPFQAIKFAKMKTYGLAELITNDPTSTAGKQGKKIKFAKLFREDKEFAIKIAHYLEENKKKLKFFSFVNGELKYNIDDKGKKFENRGGESEIYIDAPYTKTTKFELEEANLENGNQVCYLTGEAYKKLMDVKNTSPFLSGLLNFNSHFTLNDKKISWKAMYVSRFSPKLSFYSYSGPKDSIGLAVYLFIADNLLNLRRLFRQNLSIYKNKIELVKDHYSANFELYNWGSDKRFDIYTEKFEFLFMLIYTFYKNFLETAGIDIEKKSMDWDLFKESDYQDVPISLVCFKARPLGNTLRPYSFEEIDKFKFIVRMIFYLEKNGVMIRNVLQGLKFLKPSLKKNMEFNKRLRLERIMRNRVLEKVVKFKSILEDIETLFFNCYKLLAIKEDVGGKDFNQLMRFVFTYEKFIHYGGEGNMDPELQEKSINLGKSIGQGILLFENPDKNPEKKKSNARNGRGYIISLKKSRTMKQFLDEIIRLQTKYSISVSSEIVKKINPQNFETIKQFAIISALNQLNTVLQPVKKEDKNETQ
ncbi:MAG: hypothetical protein JSV88_26305 [Candidatus Aminicenantes bacterium]|nr:MAG: hypothetical protein JSV88_26305 [Candidatus Aminicenantes bacterium]